MQQMKFFVQLAGAYVSCQSAKDFKWPCGELQLQKPSAGALKLVLVGWIHRWEELERLFTKQTTFSNKNGNPLKKILRSISIKTVVEHPWTIVNEDIILFSGEQDTGLLSAYLF